MSALCRLGSKLPVIVLLCPDFLDPISLLAFNVAKIKIKLGLYRLHSEII